MHKRNRSPQHPMHLEQIDGGEAFIADYRQGFRPIGEGDVEAFGEEFIAGATSNDAIGELARDEPYAEELDGLAIDLYDEDELDLADVN